MFWYKCSLTMMLFSHSVVLNSLRHSGMQHARLPGASQFPSIWSNSYPLSHDSIQPSHPLLFPSLLSSIFPRILVFSNKSTLHIRWPKYWNFSSFISPSNEYLGLFSFRIDWFDLFAVQVIFKSLLQHHSLKASILGCSAFFMVRLSHLHITIGGKKT